MCISLPPRLALFPELLNSKNFKAIKNPQPFKETYQLMGHNLFFPLPFLEYLSFFILQKSDKAEPSSLDDSYVIQKIKVCVNPLIYTSKKLHLTFIHT